MSKPPHVYLGTERADDLARISLALLSELWVLRDRVTVLEHVLEQKGSIARQELDKLMPEGELAEELARERREMVERVLGAPFSTQRTI